MDSPSKRQQLSEAPTTLPEDLILSEILLRLPAETIGRFRFASKLFLSCTTHPHFILTHAAAAASSSPSGFFLNSISHPTAEQFPLNLNPTPDDDEDDDPSGGGSGLSDPFLSSLDYNGNPPKVLDARHGLILLRQRGTHRNPRPSAICVCNPTTRSCHFIPEPRGEVFRDQEFSFSNKLYLAFDPSLSPHFKVVSVQLQPPYNFFIFSSDTRRWKLLVHNYHQKVDHRSCPYFSWGFGAVQWKGLLIFCHSCPEYPLVSLATATEQLGSLQLPNFQSVLYQIDIDIDCISLR